MKPWETEEATEPSKEVQLQEQLKMSREERAGREKRKVLAEMAHATWTFNFLLVVARLKESTVEHVLRAEGRSKEGRGLTTYEELAGGEETRLRYYEAFVAIETVEEIAREAVEWRWSALKERCGLAQ